MKRKKETMDDVLGKEMGEEKNMKLQESGEMYLETLLVLLQQKPHVRAVDVGDYMGYSKPSVSRAMGLLKEGGLVQTDDAGYLILTDAGRSIAEKTYERHRVLASYFVRLGVSEETAARDACKIEHVISDETFEAIKRHAAGEKA